VHPDSRPSAGPGPRGEAPNAPRALTRPDHPHGTAPDQPRVPPAPTAPPDHSPAPVSRPHPHRPRTTCSSPPHRTTCSSPPHRTTALARPRPAQPSPLTHPAPHSRPPPHLQHPPENSRRPLPPEPLPVIHHPRRPAPRTPRPEVPHPHLSDVLQGRPRSPRAPTTWNNTRDPAPRSAPAPPTPRTRKPLPTPRAPGTHRPQAATGLPASFPAHHAPAFPDPANSGQPQTGPAQPGPPPGRPARIAPAPPHPARHRPHATAPSRPGRDHVSTSYRSVPSPLEQDGVRPEVRDTGRRTPLRSWAEGVVRSRPAGQARGRRRHPSTRRTRGNQPIDRRVDTISEQYQVGSTQQHDGKNRPRTSRESRQQRDPHEQDPQDPRHAHRRSDGHDGGGAPWES
jgi:hypothetical protein